MQNANGKTPDDCRETGVLIFKDYCYALRRDDGKELWLEMDRIPCHLTDTSVEVEGKLFGADLVSVERIGPV